VKAVQTIYLFRHFETLDNLVCAGRLDEKDIAGRHAYAGEFSHTGIRQGIIIGRYLGQRIKDPAKALFVYSTLSRSWLCSEIVAKGWKVPAEKLACVMDEVFDEEIAREYFTDDLRQKYEGLKNPPGISDFGCLVRDRLVEIGRNNPDRVLACFFHGNKIAYLRHVLNNDCKPEWQYRVDNGDLCVLEREGNNLRSVGKLSVSDIKNALQKKSIRLMLSP
jgi:broad specificity phosphatase PhoE